jgi:glycerophosphoryl diester phosphodiesterase
MPIHSRPLIIGHRGASASAPENTLAAFKMAIESGADGIEFDVRLSRDGVPVIIHDETLKRTAGLPQRVDTLSAAELQRTNVGSWFSQSRELGPTRFGEEVVPILQSLLDLFSHNRAVLYLEMKSASARRVELASACCTLIRANSFVDRTVIESFDLSAIEVVKSIDPEIRTAALFEPRLSSTLSLRGSKLLVDQATAVHANEIALHHSLANRRLIEKAQRAGLKVVVWTVDTPEWLERTHILNVDALITNDPARMIRCRDKLRAV